MSLFFRLLCFSLGTAAVGTAAFPRKKTMATVAATIPSIRAAELDALLNKHEIVVLALFKEGCPFCAIAAPKIAALAEQYHASSYGGRVLIAQIEKAAAVDLRARYGVTQFPTVLFFAKHEKNPFARIADSSAPVEDYKEKIEKRLRGSAAP